MKVVAVALQFFFFMFLLIGGGCQLPSLHDNSSTDTGEVNRLSVYNRYAPAKIDIMPLTEFISGDDNPQGRLSLYVSLLDSFGSQIKSPCVLRFELYKRVQRSSEPKGRRVIIWPDIDLTDPAKNNEYWRDFLRAYEINLPFEPVTDQDYILQVTCMSPNGKRLSTEFNLKHTK